MEMQLVKSAGVSDKVVAAVVEGVSKSVVDQNTTVFNQVKGQLDEILKTVKNGAPVASAPAQSGPSTQQPQQPQYQNPPPQATRPTSSAPRDPNAKHFKFNW